MISYYSYFLGDGRSSSDVPSQLDSGKYLTIFIFAWKILTKPICFIFENIYFIYTVFPSSPSAAHCNISIWVDGLPSAAHPFSSKTNYLVNPSAIS